MAKHDTWTNDGTFALFGAASSGTPTTTEPTTEHPAHCTCAACVAAFEASFVTIIGPAPTVADPREGARVDVMHDHPLAIGKQADEHTYLCQHPMIEVYTAGLVLDDTKQDLRATIGKRTVRYWHHDESTRTDENSVHKTTCAVVGTVFHPDTNTDRLRALDAVTAPWGGRDECGPAACAWSHNNNRLADCETWLRVNLPRAISAILTVDGQERRVEFLAETHNDSSRVDRFHVVVRNTYNGAGVLLRGTALETRGRHTRRSLLLTQERIAKLADELPAKIAAHADALRKLAATYIDADELLRLALIIANGGDDVCDADTNVERLWTRAIRMYTLVVNADRVPRSPLADEGLYTAHALFEAASWLEVRTDWTWSEYARRLVAGETMADVAFRMLLGSDVEVHTATIPGKWEHRFVSATMLPDLDPMPEGHSVAPWIDVDAIRRAWCTTLARDAIEADERIEMMCRITDPLHVLSIVAPYVPVVVADQVKA